MVPYKEAWMGTVDAMKQAQGWTGDTITHFRNLAVFGEQIVLSVRWGNWWGHRRSRECQELGQLLEAGNPELHTCL